MEYRMNLHKDNQAFTNAIQAASDSLNILPAFIEKDYWITLALKRLSESPSGKPLFLKAELPCQRGIN